MESLALVYNAVEVVLWTSLGIAVLVRSRRSPDPRLRRIGLVATGAFLLFGASDAVEMKTGAWWNPWWLFVWKAGCVIALLACLFARRRHREIQPKIRIDR